MSAFQRFYQQGRADADTDWSEATGFKSLADAQKAKRSGKAAKRRLEVEFPGRWVVVDGQRRFVRGYPGGRFGYWDVRDGSRLFVDVDPGLGVRS